MAGQHGSNANSPDRDPAGSRAVVGATGKPAAALAADAGVRLLPDACRAYALLMRRHVANVGLWLAGTAIAVGMCGYLIATVSAGGRHPTWPYLLFGGLAVVGGGLCLAGRHGDQRSAMANLVDAPVMPLPQQGSLPRAPVSVPSGRITSVREHGKVDHEQLITGVVASIPATAQPWLVVRPRLDGVFYPQPKLSPNPEGKFQSPVCFGKSAAQNVGEKFELLLVLARRGDPEFYTSEYMRMLPGDAQVLDYRIVIRG